MIALWVYLAIGMLVLVVMLIHSRRTGSGSANSQLLASLRGPQSRREKFLETYVVPVLASALFIAGWPVGLWMVWREKRKDALEAKRKEEARFRVRQADLRERLSIEQVEASALIHDPLGAVPALPFGHLNPVWQNFLKERSADAELWSFDCDWTNEWSVRYHRQGHVWVVNGQPGPWMLKLDQRMEENRG